MAEPEMRFAAPGCQLPRPRESCRAVVGRPERECPSSPVSKGSVDNLGVANTVTPLGVTLDREQSLRWLAARDAGREPIPAEVSAWTRRLLGLPAETG